MLGRKEEFEGIVKNELEGIQLIIKILISI